MKKWKATASYAVLQASMWGFYAIIVGFSSSFMYGHGFTDGQISIVLGITTALSCAAQLLLAELIARTPKLTVYRVLLVLSLALLACGLLMSMAAAVPAILGLGLGLILLQALPAMANSIGMDSLNQGSPLNYDIARGIGSGGYSLLSLLTGLLVSRLGVEVLWVLTVVDTLVFLGSVLWFHRAGEISAPPKVRVQEKRQGSFLQAYPRFALVLLGSIVLMVSHNLVCSFLLQIVVSKGGDASHQGIAAFVSAMTEIPVMFAFGWLLKKKGVSFWFGFSASVFVLKPLLLFLATGVWGVYGAQTTQMIGYAVYVMASAYYAGSATDKDDMVRAQSYMTAAIPIGSLIANSTGGFLCQYYTPQGMLLVSTVVAVIGGIIVIAGIRLNKRTV